MLRFAGVRDFKLTPEATWPKLRDAGFLAQCIPGVAAITTQDQDRAVCTVRPGLSFVQGSLEVTLQVKEISPGKAAVVNLVSKGIGAMSEIEARFDLGAIESGGRLEWSAEIVKLGGLLKALPQGLIKASAQKIIEDLLSCVESKLRE
jgi:carbon monoxide dehydrogenase subunit G